MEIFYLLKSITTIISAFPIVITYLGIAATN